MVTVLLVLVVISSGGFVVFQFARYGFVSPAAALCRLVGTLPRGVADHFPTPSFGTLERLVLGEIALSRFSSTDDGVKVPRRFEVALSESNWETVKDSPEYFLSDMTTAAQELANRRGWGADDPLEICWITRTDVQKNRPRVVAIGLASTARGESLERLIVTGGSALRKAEATAKAHRSERIDRGRVARRYRE